MSHDTSKLEELTDIKIACIQRGLGRVLSIHRECATDELFVQLQEQFSKLTELYISDLQRMKELHAQLEIIHQRLNQLEKQKPQSRILQEKLDELTRIYADLIVRVTGRIL